MAARRKGAPRDHLVTQPRGPRAGSLAGSGQGAQKPKRVTRLFFGVFFGSGPVWAACVISGPRLVLPRGALESGRCS